MDADAKSKAIIASSFGIMKVSIIFISPVIPK
jgi:hypothetical protein